MKSKHRIAELIQKIVDKKNLKNPLIKKIEIFYSEAIDYYVVSVSVKRDDLLKEYKKLYKEAENDYWKGKYEDIINYYLCENCTLNYNIKVFLDVNKIDELYDTIKKLFTWSSIHEGHISFSIKILL
jgi:hypothetical protein